MGISRWPYRRLEALKQELHDIEERLKNVSIQSIKSNNSTSTSQFFNTNSNNNNTLQCSPPPQSNTTSSATQLQLEESILKGSIELIHHIPNIIVKHSNEHIKEIARKTQRISLSNLLNL